MTYLAYLDEFGHIGPYVSKEDPKYNESPVFGFAGFVLPAEEVRGFGTWFFQRKCQLLNIEIQQSEKHPAFWEKKGSSLYTVRNILRYPELRHFTYRLFNKIENLGGFVFYVGIPFRFALWALFFMEDASCLALASVAKSIHSQGSNVRLCRP